MTRAAVSCKATLSISDEVERSFHEMFVVFGMEVDVIESLSELASAAIASTSAYESHRYNVGFLT